MFIKRRKRNIDIRISHEIRLQESSSFIATVLFRMVPNYITTLIRWSYNFGPYETALSQ